MSEDQHIEWKSSWRDEYLKWICGFANGAGGMLVIGRNDKGVVTGVTNANRLMEEIPNKTRDILGILVDVNLCREKKQDYLEIKVEAYPNPVNYKGEYYYRSGSTNQVLKGAALDKFLLRKQGRHWDGVPAPQAGIKDLSKGIVKTFSRKAKNSGRLNAATLQESAAVLIEKLHLIDGKYLKRAALLLFHPDPEQFVTGAFVKIGFFRTNTDLLYQDEVHGDLFTQVEKTMELLLTKYLRAGISYEGVQRLETYSVPEAALREALLNAIIHKDYGSGAPIQISVYPDKIMLWNSGLLPTDWTVDRLLEKHPSQPFNPDIANVFFRAGMIEAWGRGIERMMEACAKADVPTPELRYEQCGLWVEFGFSEAYLEATTPKTTQETAQETTKETAQETTQEMILALLRVTPTMTGKQLAEKIAISESGIKYHLTKLRAEGRIQHVGSTKAGKWEVLKDK